MRTTLSEQQTAFFTKNGYIEFEIPHSLPAPQPERDQWRQHRTLQEFLTRKLGPIALILTGKKQLHLACDQWVTQENRPEKAGPYKESLCIQGLALGVAIAPNPIAPARKSSLGILPLPSSSSHILFFRPELILDWPHVSSNVYLAFFSLPNAVYTHNEKDRSTYFLKSLGYDFGDVLKNDTHPLILA